MTQIENDQNIGTKELIWIMLQWRSLIQQQNITCCSIHFQFCLNSCQTGNELVDLRVYSLFLIEGLKKKLLLMVPFFFRTSFSKKSRNENKFASIIVQQTTWMLYRMLQMEAEKRETIIQFIACYIYLILVAAQTHWETLIIWCSLQLKFMNKMINDVLKFSVLLNSWTIRTRHVFAHTTAQLW